MLRSRKVPTLARVASVVVGGVFFLVVIAILGWDALVSAEPQVNRLMSVPVLLFFVGGFLHLIYSALSRR